MVSFRDAIKRADELGANNGVCNEYEKSYVFKVEGSTIGVSPLVIDKATGTDWNYPAWIAEEGNGKYLKTFTLNDGEWVESIDEDMLDEEDED